MTNCGTCPQESFMMGMMAGMQEGQKKFAQALKKHAKAHAKHAKAHAKAHAEHHKAQCHPHMKAHLAKQAAVKMGCGKGLDINVPGFSMALGGGRGLNIQTGGGSSRCNIPTPSNCGWGGSIASGMGGFSGYGQGSFSTGCPQPQMDCPPTVPQMDCPPPQMDCPPPAPQQQQCNVVQVPVPVPVPVKVPVPVPVQQQPCQMPQQQICQGPQQQNFNTFQQQPMQYQPAQQQAPCIPDCTPCDNTPVFQPMSCPPQPCDDGYSGRSRVSVNVSINGTPVCQQDC